MKELCTEVEIAASPERVWQVLTDFPALTEWNPFVRRAEGDLRAGERLKVQLKPPRGMGMTVQPTVLKAEPGAELRWIGHLVMPGLFDGEHQFLIHPLEGGRVRFIQRETFRGVLVPLMGIVGLFRSTQAGFDAMNQALKERAEQSAGP